MDHADSFRNLLIVAASDGRMTESELRLLADRATQWGITDDQFESMLEEAITGRVELVVPEDPAERKLVVKDMIRMMAADGEMSEPEKQLFAAAATMMGMDAVRLNDLIDQVLDEDNV